MAQAIPDKLDFPQTEEETLAYWKSIDAFQKSLKLAKGRPRSARYLYNRVPPACLSSAHILVRLYVLIYDYYHYYEGIHSMMDHLLLLACHTMDIS